MQMSIKQRLGSAQNSRVGSAPVRPKTCRRFARTVRCEAAPPAGSSTSQPVAAEPAVGRLSGQSNIVAAPSKVEKVRDPVPDVELAKLKETLKKSRSAQQQYSTFTQEQVDTIFKACALAANAARIPLAKMAVEETRMGVVEDKVIKNH
eukprot:CAMPEP_0202868548 /NCGR_PEP_ID=MMETSP1391-20130828/10942_1 /ASSEMBLY_ACC=CAM_ASM_000867 /TAXON_ID=1034604 /ORGANISM="Chlamydomonas leiostraca, Strain SAG 11-49" /LENGTH=148 /DNA_ID=CAMNT_0049548733 /DNA_START=65 /DNA_END=508 /DNA_ORIENTATION=+